MSDSVTPPLSPQATTQLSKLLSYILRHGAVKEKLTMSSDGYIAVQDLLAHPKFKDVNIEQIQYVVDTNDKKRYELVLTDGQYKIRANQGHSLKNVDSHKLLEQITQIDTPVIHGTRLQAWEHIKTKGLSTMNRNHVHFAIGLPGDSNVRSGVRKSSQVFIYIDVHKAMQDGIAFYRSKNDVILSDGKDGIIEPKYFEKVIDTQGTSLL